MQKNPAKELVPAAATLHLVRKIMGDQVELSYKIAGWDQLKMSVVKTSSKDFPSELL